MKLWCDERGDYVKVICELYDYEDSKHVIDAPRVIISDAWADRDMVRITIGGKTVKVVAKDLIKAIDSCTNLPI